MATSTSGSTSTTGNSSNVPNFVDNVWVAGANDTLKAQDVYAAPTNDVVSSAPLKPTSMDSLSDSIRGNIKSLASSVRTVASVLKTVQAAQKALKSGDFSLAARALGDNKALQNAVKGLNISIDPSTIKNFQAAGKLGVTLGGVYKDVSATKFNDLNSVGKLVGVYSKDNALFQVKDLGADVAKACTVVNACVKNGVPNSVPMALNVLGQDGPIKQFVAGSLGTVVKQSDIAALSDLNSAVGKSGLLKMNPTVVSDVSRVFSNPVFAALPDKTAHFDKTIATFDAVDDKWCKNTVGTDSTVDITKITSGSADMKDLVSHGALASTSTGATGSADTNKLLGFGGMYNSTSVLTELSSQFPATVVNANTVTKSTVTNPVFGSWESSLLTTAAA